MVQFILGFIISGHVHQRKVALGFDSHLMNQSICQKIRRFLKEQVCDPKLFARLIVQLALGAKPFHLVLDRTNWKFGKLHVNLLVLAVQITNRFAIPLFIKALPKAGNSHTDERIDLFHLFIDTFGSSRIATFTADREFIGKDWFQFLTDHHIPFYIRLKANRLVEYGKEYVSIGIFFEHLQKGQKRLLEKPIHGTLLYFAGTKSTDNELVIIASNCDHGFQILDIYRRRWTIEIMFKHTKTNGFNLESTHLVHIERIEKLMMLMAVALAVCHQFGQKQETISKTPFKKTVQSPLFSTFRQGFDGLRRILIQAFPQAISWIYSTFQNAFLSNVG